MITSNIKNDGYGAQLLAKITAYVFCRYYDIEYNYTPIIKCAHTNLQDLDKFFLIESFTPKNYSKNNNINKTVIIQENQCKDLEIFRKIITNRYNINYNIAQCHWFLEENPNLYYNIDILNHIRNMYYKSEKKHSQLFINLKNKNRKIVSIHIRRNDITKINHPSRYIELSIYKYFIEETNKNYDNLSFIIYTDSKNNECNKLLSDNVFLNKCNEKESFHDFVESDILLISISSFSYIPALLSKNIIYFFNNYMFKGLNNWIQIN